MRGQIPDVAFPNPDDRQTARFACLHQNPAEELAFGCMDRCVRAQDGLERRQRAAGGEENRRSYHMPICRQVPHRLDRQSIRRR